MSNITDTVETGAMTHNMRLVIPERFCSADITSEGDTPLYEHMMTCALICFGVLQACTWQERMISLCQTVSS